VVLESGGAGKIKLKLVQPQYFPLKNIQIWKAACEKLEGMMQNENRNHSNPTFLH